MPADGLGPPAPFFGPPPVRSAKPRQGSGGYALSTLTRSCSAHPPPPTNGFSGPRFFFPVATPRRARARLPLVDSARLRRPPAPPVRSAKPRQGPGGYALSTLTRFCSAHPATTGLRPAPAVLDSSLFPEGGTVRSFGSQTNRPSFRKDLWGQGLADTPGNPVGIRIGERLWNQQ